MANWWRPIIEPGRISSFPWIFLWKWSMMRNTNCERRGGRSMSNNRGHVRVGGIPTVFIPCVGIINWKSPMLPDTASVPYFRELLGIIWRRGNSPVETVFPFTGEPRPRFSTSSPTIRQLLPAHRPKQRPRYRILVEIRTRTKYGARKGATINVNVH